MRLVIGSSEDPASVSMSEFILEHFDMEDAVDFPGLKQHGDFYFMMINEKHLYCDYLDEFVKSKGLNIEGIIFLSKHSSAMNIKSLSVHPTGNFSDAKLGGKDGMLSQTDPEMMSAALRTLKSAYKGEGFDITFEATHHGPHLETPHFFIEIGTTENEWTDEGALSAVADAVFKSSTEKFRTFVGVGGGHYMPKISKYFFENDVNIGHMIPKYQMNTLSKELVVQTVEKTPMCSGFVVDSKGTKSRARDIVAEVSNEYNLEMIKI